MRERPTSLAAWAKDAAFQASARTGAAGHTGAGATSFVSTGTASPNASNAEGCGWSASAPSASENSCAIQSSRGRSQRRDGGGAPLALPRMLRRKCQSMCTRSSSRSSSPKRAPHVLHCRGRACVIFHRIPGSPGGGPARASGGGAGLLGGALRRPASASFPSNLDTSPTANGAAGALAGFAAVPAGGAAPPGGGGGGTSCCCCCCCCGSGGGGGGGGCCGCGGCEVGPDGDD